MAAISVHESIPGLSIWHDICTPEDEATLIAWLDTQPWTAVNPRNPESRRVQQYGHGYGYTGRNLTDAMAMTGHIATYAEFFRQQGLLDAVQCIVNEYGPTQGISAHIDSLHFGPQVLGLSVGADASMIFRRGEERISVFLPRRSLMLMEGEARTLWSHEIPATKSYVGADGSRVMKSDDYRRISLTFRELGS